MHEEHVNTFKRLEFQTLSTYHGLELKIDLGFLLDQREEYSWGSQQFLLSTSMILESWTALTVSRFTQRHYKCNSDQISYFQTGLAT